MSKDTQENILPAEPSAALVKLAEITESLTALIRDEANHVAMNDAVGFVSVEADKEAQADLYERAAKEFSQRLEEFTRQDPALLDRFEEAQKTLKKVTQDNMVLLERLK